MSRALDPKTGNIAHDVNKILNIQSEFYKHLYQSDSSVHFDMTNSSGIFVQPQDKLRLEQGISEGEIFDAIMTLKPNKTPGCDGLPIEFYRKFWTILKEYLVNLYKDCVKNGELNFSARKGIINLIPKKAKDTSLVKNWRPITLLNYDYKIFVKILSNRLETVIQSLIGTQQSGFVKGRSIHNNLRTTHEILVQLNKNNKPGVLAILDWEKCFDRAEYRSLGSTLRYFGFPEKFIELTMMLYTNFYFCTSNNGFFSDFKLKERGVNQGCPASPLVWLLAGELLSHQLKYDSIKGVPLPALKDLLSQFADDTGAFLLYSQENIERFCPESVTH